MKLSEAIRLGAMATEQGYGCDSIVSNTAPCALGAARLAGGVARHKTVLVYSDLQERWPILGRMVDVPACLHEKHRGMPQLMHVVWMLNDVARWTREQIADFVESVEQAQDADAVARSAADQHEPTSRVEVLKA